MSNLKASNRRPEKIPYRGITYNIRYTKSKHNKFIMKYRVK